jgi:hypothetical protein
MIGTVAVRRGALTIEQVLEVLEHQSKTGLPFLRQALTLNLMDDQTAGSILEEQRRDVLPLGRTLVAVGAIDEETLARELDRLLHDAALESVWDAPSTPGTEASA